MVSSCSGFGFELREVDREELEDHIIAANEDKDVDGIIVYYPIFCNRQDQYLQQITDISKDVEGLNHRYLFNMYQNIRFLDEQKLQKSILVKNYVSLSMLQKGNIKLLTTRSPVFPSR
jgi:methylenetetrahydrofolate dehydrogenase (NAD+)